MEESDPVRLLSYRLWVRNYDSLDITNADLMVAMHVGKAFIEAPDGGLLQGDEVQ